MTHGAAEFHKVWRVGANIDTDAMAPGAYMKHGIEVIASHCFRCEAG
jgi:3-isopropylmalate/(R)-2-methylmalate dehydratase small subunit